MKLRMLILAAALTCVLTSAVAQNPFDGTWALNQSKSQLTGGTMTFAPAGDGSMKFTSSEQTYTFKTDGSEATTPLGRTVTWKQVDPQTYQHTTARNGKQLSDSTWKLSDGDKTLTIDSHGTKPNGENWKDSATYTRVGDGKGLAGTWKSTAVKLGNPNTMTMSTVGGDGMKLDISAEQASWQGKLDGKDYPATGPTVPEGITLALTQTSPNSFKMVEKVKDKPIYIGEYSVSSDGKTMTVKGTNGEGKEPFTEVWEKKS